jgi:hypothetical protein
MDQDHFPWPTGHHLPPELFDHYVAKARAERAKAIADLGGWIARQVRIVAARFAPRDRTAAPVASRKLVS